MNMELKDLSLGEIIEQLTILQNQGCGDWKVRIVNRDGHRSCIGKILGAGRKDGGTIALFPVPEDIGCINALTKMMAMMSCDKAAKGQDCNTCPNLAICEHMKRFDENWKLIYEGGKDDKVQ